jgi:hypothetical protein
MVGRSSIRLRSRASATVALISFTPLVTAE